MLTDYICVDVLKHILQIYISHHPEDIDTINKFTNFKFDHVKIEEKNYYGDRNELFDKESIIDGYKIRYQRWKYNEDGKRINFEEFNYKLGKIHGKTYTWDNLGRIIQEHTHKNGKVQYVYRYNYLLNGGIMLDVYIFEDGIPKFNILKQKNPEDLEYKDKLSTTFDDNSNVTSQITLN